MATIHFLNVKEGDCSIIEHNSDHRPSLMSATGVRLGLYRLCWPSSPRSNGALRGTSSRRSTR